MQRVRRALGVERGALAHAEAVLLVDHRQRQRPEAHLGLDQRVRADDQGELAAGELAQQVGPPARRGRAGEQPKRYGLVAEQALQRRKVLFGERLGRRHQRRLLVLVDGAQHRVERHDRLAAADLAHQQPLHRDRLGQVGRDLLDRPPLVACELEGERLLEPARAHRPAPAQADRACSRPAQVAASQEQQLRQQQLIEGEPRPARGGILAITREVHRRKRARSLGQRLARAQRRGQELDDVAERGACLAHTPGAGGDWARS